MTPPTTPATPATAAGSAAAGTHRFDEIDHRILAELARDGRLSNTDLAHRIGLSPSACWTRVRALESSGVIKGYAAIIDRAAIGLPETVVVEVTVDKQKHTGDVLEGFEAAILQMPQVIEASLVAGDFDYYLRVAASSTADYEHFLREKLYRIPGVRQARSIFILREIARPLAI
ncbi:MAG TPA: Lrp/AsnC family transcriptional regulator [Steroidobacteraceae bacterium]|nr:Lrp/AsnC family transcriptional regulator [Steroidobacteraceae bacterium]